MDVKVGRNAYTPVLGPKGGFKKGLTITPMADNRFRVLTGGAHRMADRKWFRDEGPQDGGTHIEDHTSAPPRIWFGGPRARDVLALLTSDEVSNEGFRCGTFKTVAVDGIDVLASRIRYGGDLGWEPFESKAMLALSGVVEVVRA